MDALLKFAYVTAYNNGVVRDTDPVTGKPTEVWISNWDPCFKVTPTKRALFENYKKHKDRANIAGLIFVGGLAAGVTDAVVNGKEHHTPLTLIGGTASLLGGVAHSVEESKAKTYSKALARHHIAGILSNEDNPDNREWEYLNPRAGITWSQMKDAKYNSYL